MKKLFLILLAIIALSLPAYATDVTVAANTVPNFNPSGIGTDLAISVTVTNASPVVTSAAQFRSTWVGMSGFRVTINGTAYTVASVDSTSQITLTTNYAGASSSTLVSLTWHKYVELRLYANKAFQPLGATYIVQTGAPGSGAWYKRVAASIVNVSGVNTLYIPALTVDATVDAPVNNTAKYIAGFYRPDGSFIQYYDCFNQFAVPGTSANTSWTALCTYNQSLVIITDNSAYTKPQIDARFPNCTAGQLYYFASTGNTVTCLNVGTNLSISAGALNASGGGGGGTITGGGASGQVTYWTGGTAIGGENAFYYDAVNDRLGLGTTSPASSLHLKAAAGLTSITNQGSLSTVTGVFATDDSTTKSYIGTSTAHTFSLYTNSTERATILSTGVMGVNKTAPSAQLHVQSGDASRPVLYLDSQNAPTVEFLKIRDASTDRLVIGSRGELLTSPDGRVVAAPGPYVRLQTPADDTNMAADTNSYGIQFGGDASALPVARTFLQGGGSFNTQEENIFVHPIYAFTLADTIVDAATVSISGAPQAGLNATITRGYSLWTRSGDVRIDGGLVLGAPDLYLGRAANGVLGIVNSIGGLEGGTLAFGAASPAQITSNQNDYTVTSKVSLFIRLSTDASRDLTGLSTGQQNGQIHYIHNVGSNNLVLKHQSASSAAGNRFLNSTGADITLGANQTAYLQYDSTTQRWRVSQLGGGGTTLAGLPAQSVQYNNGSNAFEGDAGFLYDSASATATLGVASANAGKLRFRNATNANTSTIQPAVTSSNLTFTLPDSLPGSGSECLQISSTGAITRTGSTCGSGGGSITGSGANTQVTYWTGASTVSGEAGFSWTTGTKTLALTGHQTITQQSTSIVPLTVQAIGSSSVELTHWKNSSAATKLGVTTDANLYFTNQTSAVTLSSAGDAKFYFEGTAGATQYQLLLSKNGAAYKPVVLAAQGTFTARNIPMWSTSANSWEMTNSIMDQVSNTGITIIPSIAASGSPATLSLTGASDITQAADTEKSDVIFNFNRTVQFNAGGGTFPTQRVFRIAAPTYSASATETMPLAIGFDVNSASAGTNMTITESFAARFRPSVAAHHGVWVDGQASHTGDLLVAGFNATKYIRFVGGTTAVNAVFGNGALSTSATDGFVYLPSSAGVPTGTPTSFTGTVPVEIDTTNSRLYAYIGGAWANLSGSGGSSPPFADNTDIIKDDADATKLLRFSIGGFPTATTRTLTPQNASYTLAGLETAQTFTALQTIDVGTTPGDGLTLSMAAPASNGSRDSHNFTLRGASYDGTAHTTDWRQRVDVTSNSGVSRWYLESRVDAAAFTERISVSDAGTLNAVIYQSFGLALDTEPTNSVGSAEFLFSVTKNDSNTRSFHGLNINPEISAGASNLNTTLNVINVDTTNFTTTGVTTNLLRLSFNGSLAFNVDSLGAMTLSDGVRQTFNPNGTTPGFNVGSNAGAPSSPNNGDAYYDSTSNLWQFRQNGVWAGLGGASPAGSGNELQARENGTTFRAVTGSSVSTLGELDLNNTARTSGATPAYRFRRSADTNTTASTDTQFLIIGGDGSGATVTTQSATGSKTLQREVLVVSPTYSAVGASGFTRAITWDMSSPIAGTNVTFTHANALRLNASAAGHVPLFINGASSHTNALQEWAVNSTVKSAVTAGGNFYKQDDSAGGGQNNAVFVGSSGNYGGIWMGSGAGAPSLSNYIFLYDNASPYSIINTPSGGGIQLRINNISSPPALAVASTARVGINVAGPVTQLHVLSASNSVAAGYFVSGTASTEPSLVAEHSTANTNTITVANLDLRENTTGTPTAGFGGRILMKLESSTTVDQDSAAFNWRWHAATHASRTSFVDIATVSNAGSLVSRFVTGPRTTLTDASATSVFEIALPTLAGASGVIHATIFATDGTDVQVRSTVIRYSAVNKGGTYTTEISEVSTALSASTGTLDDTWTILNGTNKVTIQLNADTSLTPTIFYVTYTVTNDSAQAITVL